MVIIDECSNGFDDFGNCNSNWDRWGRWVAVGCLIAAAIILFFLLACLRNRRRRRLGLRPMYGTGWVGGGPSGGQPYRNQGYNNDLPPYGAPVGYQQTGNTFNSNEGYYGNPYGGQQTGIELQQPPNAYTPQRGGLPVYGVSDGSKR